MLNNIYLSLKEYLTNAFPQLNIDDYRGEFKDKTPADWNPRFPCCLIMLDEYAPLIRSSGNEIIKHSVNFTLYIAEKNSNGFAIIQDIIDELNGASINVPSLGSYYPVKVNSVKFVTGIKSVRVHSIDVQIQ